MSFRPSYPDVSVGSGFVYVCPKTGTTFRHPILVQLHRLVSDYAKANSIDLNNDEFDDNVCKNTQNIVCTESARGAGDIAHSVLNPVGKVIDNIFGTNTQGCHGCYKRQNNLNK